MEERHDREQYFFDEETLDHLSSFVSAWESPCCICAPSVGRRLAEAGVAVTVLDVDERFADVPGFRHFDLMRPEWIQERFDLILCDPPFFGPSLSQLFTALRGLSQNDFSQALLVSFLTRRKDAILGVFEKFQLRETGYMPGYATVDRGAKNEIEFFGNLSEEDHKRLREVRRDV